ncbi:imidazole glycerol phosphate synthase subunit HisH [Lyngbya confervoides]|uniref:Imidazole glycerol phosphate synthase subunit HisH n=1 Tax=Lyngbya confervoides BDU141951 TaxID=1574623 RepID=A0ABD4T8I8_9CYAN|nr:imidazole glycerol phosphate synthase subunit HisH [Lyngbya confervoides]MCM1985053.1 imidazole glycerol phosphate synthase subunit HisH [Lyngbya confervoides BDU141951]
MTTIAVIDYDMGNLHSVCKGLQNAGAQTVVSDQATVMDQADGIVLPGVGAFDPAMDHLRSRQLEPVIIRTLQTGKPFLGICLGLQVLFEGSEEGNEPGLGIFQGTVRRFAPEPELTIPHMGWNQLQISDPQQPLWQDLPAHPWVYFVHSYYVAPEDESIVAATTTHGRQTVTAAIASGNIFAVQFHPEKSSLAGLQLLSNFVNRVKAQKQSPLVQR